MRTVLVPAHTAGRREGDAVPQIVETIQSYHCSRKQLQGRYRVARPRGGR